MTAPVDVLALLDAYIAHGIPQERPDLQRARHAVAELIDALRECVEAEQPMAQMHATERARAALARVGAK